MSDMGDGTHGDRSTEGGPVPRPALRRRRTAALGALGTLALALSLTACDTFAGLTGDGPEPSPSSPVDLRPMDPAAVDTAPSTPVDPSWLCRPGEVDPPVRSTSGGALIPDTVTADGNVLEVTGFLHLEPDHAYTGFAPVGVLLPADPADRGAVAPDFTGELGVEGAPVPPIVVRERVEIPGEGVPPATAIARLTLGTCDDSPLPDGQYLLRLSGGGLDDPAPGEEHAGWSASEDVLVDVVDGALEVVPGAVTAPSGEVPVDLSPLHCGARLVPLGEGDDLALEVADPTTRVSTRVPEDGIGNAVTAEVTVTSPDRGTRALFQDLVITDPSTGRVVAGARSAPTAQLQWIDEDGVTSTAQAWTTQGACERPALEPGAYEARAFAVTLDADGATRLVLSEPWSVEVHEEQPAT